MNMHAFFEYGNHPNAVWVWAVAGVICGAIAPALLNEQGQVWGAGSSLGMLLGGCVTAATYVVGYSVRESAFFRATHDRPWYYSTIGNGVMFVATMSVGLHHYATPSATVAFTLLVVSAFGFVEITRPAVDYGLLQAFMRAPVLLSVQQLKLHGIGWVIPPVILALYGVIILPWMQSYRLPPKPEAATHQAEAATEQAEAAAESSVCALATLPTLA